MLTKKPVRSNFEHPLTTKINGAEFVSKSIEEISDGIYEITWMRRDNPGVQVNTLESPIDFQLLKFESAQSDLKHAISELSLVRKFGALLRSASQHINRTKFGQWLIRDNASR